jgi:solute carrier family 20 (sodium-dependent phosphate transporter)
VVSRLSIAELSRYNVIFHISISLSISPYLHIGTTWLRLFYTDIVDEVFMAWIIAPMLSGMFAAIIFTITKYAVLVRRNPALKGLLLVPIYFAITASLIVMLLVWKGGSYEINLNDTQIAAVIIGVGFGWGILVAILLVPWLYRVVIKEDWQLKWYHIFNGPLLLRRGEVPPPPPGFTGAVRNFYEGHLTKEELEARNAARIGTPGSTDDPEKAFDWHEREPERKSMVGPKPDGPWHSGPVLFWYVKWAVLHGVDQDVVSSQNKPSKLAGNMEEMHARAAHYDNRAEFLYSFLQVMTAATASFTHGANDVSK